MQAPQADTPAIDTPTTTGEQSRPADANRSRRPPISGLRFIRFCALILLAALAIVGIGQVGGFDFRTLQAGLESLRYDDRPADGRSNLNGGAASVTYIPSRDLTELITDEHWGEGPNDGARWEVRSPWHNGYNVVSLAHYIFVPSLGDPAEVKAFVAGKDDDHRSLAGKEVSHSEVVVDGRKGYVWNHSSPSGYWYYAAWFPHAVHTVRVECIAKRRVVHFRSLCEQAMATLKFAPSQTSP